MQMLQCLIELLDFGATIYKSKDIFANNIGYQMTLFSLVVFKLWIYDNIQTSTTYKKNGYIKLLLRCKGSFISATF